MENNRSAEPVYDLITCQRSKVQGEGKYARRFQLNQQPVHRMEAGRMEGGWGTCGMKLSAGCCCASVLPAGSAGCDLCGYVKRSIAQQPSFMPLTRTCHEAFVVQLMVTNPRSRNMAPVFLLGVCR